MPRDRRGGWSRTGYPAKAFDTEDLAKGITWVLAQRDSGELSQQARERAVERFGEGVVAEGYGVVYEESREYSLSTLIRF